MFLFRREFNMFCIERRFIWNKDRPRDGSTVYVLKRISGFHLYGRRNIDTF